MNKRVISCFFWIDLLKDMDYHTYYVDNNKTAEHKSFFVGIRELEKKRNMFERFITRNYESTLSIFKQLFC